MQSKRIWTTSNSRREGRADSPNTLAKPQKVCKKKKYGDPDICNDSLAGSEEMFGNKTLQTAGRSGHNCTVADKRKCKQFCVDMQEKLEEDEFHERLVFSDEATSHTNGKVNRHNVRIWGKENPHATIEHERNSPKVNVFCAISKNHVQGPFFFEGNVTGNVYLQMLQNWLMDELLANEHEDFIHQQDGAPPQWKLTMRAYLNDNLPRRWIGRASGEDNVMLKWPPRLSDLTPCNFFLWGYVKTLVYVPSLPENVNELKQRITFEQETVTQDMLHHVWEELDYRLDVCQVTGGTHIKHL